MIFFYFFAFFAIVLATAHRVVVRLANKLVEVLGHVKGIKISKCFEKFARELVRVMGEKQPKMQLLKHWLYTLA